MPWTHARQQGKGAHAERLSYFSGGEGEMSSNYAALTNAPLRTLGWTRVLPHDRRCYALWDGKRFVANRSCLEVEYLA
jgi:hypothetical protein